jgi:hypothetical protein
MQPEKAGHFQKDLKLSYMIWQNLIYQDVRMRWNKVAQLKFPGLAARSHQRLSIQEAHTPTYVAHVFVN